MDDIDILVPLLDEGVDVWRPVRASQLGGDLFLIRRASIPEIEHWMFTPGEVVRCVERVRADGKIDAVAIEALPEVPDTVKTWVELHDSELGSVEVVADRTDLVLAPAYIHRWEARGGQRIGTGWTQTARVRLLPSTPEETTQSDLGPLAGGSLETPRGTFSNLIPVPLEVAAAVHLRLEFSNGRAIDASGKGVAITLEGDPDFVESLPAEFDPGRDDPA